MPRTTAWPGSLDRWDVLLPAGVFVLGTVELFTLQARGWQYGVLLELVSCVLLVLRRERSLLTATSAVVVLLVMPWVGPRLDEPAVPILILVLAGYALARWLPDLRGLVGVGVMLAGLLVDYLLVDTRAHGLSDVMFVLSLLAPPFALGRVVRRLALQKSLLEEREDLVRREAVRDERDRIARELHDVIAHSVSAMVVQTAAAQDLLRTDPDRTEQVLADVATTGRRALAETGRLLHVIRDDSDELGLRPTPGLADVPELVERFRESGLAVDLDLSDPVPPLPAGVDVSAYRIVQEALTNALRYGADRTAALRVTGTPTGLSISASNPSAGPVTGGSGLGLLGMAERVSVLGGSLRHGPTGDGRFEVTATLPLASP